MVGRHYPRSRELRNKWPRDDPPDRGPRAPRRPRPLRRIQGRGAAAEVEPGVLPVQILPRPVHLQEEDAILCPGRMEGGRWQKREKLCGIFFRLEPIAIEPPISRKFQERLL